MVLRVRVRRASKPGWIEGVALVGGDAPDGSDAVVLTGERLVEADTRAVLGVAPSADVDHVYCLLRAGYSVRFDSQLPLAEA